MRKRKLIITFVLIGMCFILNNSCKKADSNNNPSTNGSITDIDGNVYHSVTIGTQVWMVENLKTTKYRNGNPIPNVTDKTAWGSLTTGAYCNYDNNATNSTTYGRLYNWYTVNDSRKIAPAGWHVPTSAEITTLINYLGGEGVAGSKLREAGTAHWWVPIKSITTNESGFTALPAGYRIVEKTWDFVDINEDCTMFWSTSEVDVSNAYSLIIGWDIAGDGKSASLYGDEKYFGFSIRCIKD
jgi:uncharacterized protein (TIGR02145 family)